MAVFLVELNLAVFITLVVWYALSCVVMGLLFRMEGTLVNHDGSRPDLPNAVWVVLGIAWPFVLYCAYRNTFKGGA